MLMSGILAPGAQRPQTQLVWGKWRLLVGRGSLEEHMLD